MIPEDLGDLRAAWATHPPAHIALRRLENVVRAIVGFDPADVPSSSVVQPINEDDLRTEVAMINAGM